jgi:hypothetical protein
MPARHNPSFFHEVPPSQISVRSPLETVGHLQFLQRLARKAQSCNFFRISPQTSLQLIIGSRGILKSASFSVSLHRKFDISWSQSCLKTHPKRLEDRDIIVENLNFLGRIPYRCEKPMAGSSEETLKEASTIAIAAETVPRTSTPDIVRGYWTRNVDGIIGKSSAFAYLESERDKINSKELVWRWHSWS